ncbi:MAG: hypothetical protein WC213_13720 [Arenimonas sp.]|jgi:pimeloyl-ACP methyl ester carboxylesterase
MLRTLFAIVSGIFAMMIVISFVELANIKIFFPPPEGLDWRDPQAVAAFAASLPAIAMAVVVLGWLLGAFIGAAVATRIALQYRLPSALLIGALVVAGTIHSAFTIEHPAWVVAAGVLLPIPLAYLAAKLVQKGFASTR